MGLAPAGCLTQLTGAASPPIGPSQPAGHNRDVAVPAEPAYFFQQPILRDAAYQLQMPSERARLHRGAMEILEAMFDGPPPEPELDKRGNLKCGPHPIDQVASDLLVPEFGGNDLTPENRSR